MMMSVFKIERGKFYTLLGIGGCGKTTMIEDDFVEFTKKAAYVLDKGFRLNELVYVMIFSFSFQFTYVNIALQSVRKYNSKGYTTDALLG